MRAFLTAFAVVALAELGDKTQLLVLSLSSRYSLPAVVGGALCSTVVLAAMAVAVGGVLYQWVSPLTVRMAAGLLFLVFGVWTLLAKTEPIGGRVAGSGGPFWITFVSFFLAEFGDKTQIMTMVLAARFSRPVQVALGAWAGMAVVVVSVALAGRQMGKYMGRGVVKALTALVFLAVGASLLWGVIAAGR